MSKQCELLLEYFNNQLMEEEKELFETHLNSCEACQSELREWTELTEDLPYLSEPVSPNNGMKDRILANALAQPQEAELEEEGHTTKVRTSNKIDKPKLKYKYHSIIQNGLAAALVLSLLGNIYFLNEPNNSPKTEQEDIIDQVLNTVSLQKTEFMNASGQASIVQNGDEKVLLVQADNLEKVENEQAYQVWLLEGETPYRAGTFVPNESGKGAVAFSLSKLEEENINWDTIAITLEPNPNNQTPKGNIILAAGIES